VAGAGTATAASQAALRQKGKTVRGHLGDGRGHDGHVGQHGHHRHRPAGWVGEHRDEHEATGSLMPGARRIVVAGLVLLAGAGTAATASQAALKGKSATVSPGQTVTSPGAPGGTATGGSAAGGAGGSATAAGGKATSSGTPTSTSRTRPRGR
jgi:hypothetical protein